MTDSKQEDFKLKGIDMLPAVFLTKDQANILPNLLIKFKNKITTSI